MLDRFLLHNHEKKLFSSDHRILVAVSGGMDSMVLLSLMVESQSRFGVAHVNHHLRGEESDQDAKFVQEFCARHQIPFYVHDIDPNVFEQTNIQNQARNIRYSWMSRIAAEQHFDFIATAHHQDDEIESFFLHLMRGSGLSGLDGMDPKLGKVIRPLLFATRKEIEAYARHHQVEYREDSSNISDKYLRNQLRNKILPQLCEADSRAKNGISLSISNLKKSSSLLEKLIKPLAEKCIQRNGKFISINLEEIEDSEIGSDLMYYILKDYGFNYHQTNDIFLNHGKSGNQYLSEKYVATIDRKRLLLQLNTETEENNTPLYLTPDTIISNTNFTLVLTLGTNDDSTPYQKDVQYVDADLITFPLLFRKWKPGDRFKPLGMEGKSQKVKDFLINNKISSFEKSYIYVLEQNEEIVAIPGYRVSEKYKIQARTTKILKIEWCRTDY